METIIKESITVQADVNAPVEKVWAMWNNPDDITKWCSATPEWHTPRAENDLRTGGKFSSRMEAKDGSMGFDFGGIYDQVIDHQQIDYTMGDGRKVKIIFEPNGDTTQVTETFEAEQTNPVEMQRAGWQAIMNNFKTYAESH